MRRVFGVCPAVVGLFLSTVSSVFGSPGAYLSAPVNSTALLVSRVQADPVALGSYADHFGLSREAALKYLASLRFELLPADGMFPVFTPENSESTPKLTILIKGEPVFAEISGRVILRASDGAALSSRTGEDPLTVGHEGDSSLLSLSGDAGSTGVSAGSTTATGPTLGASPGELPGASSPGAAWTESAVTTPSVADGVDTGDLLGDATASADGLSMSGSNELEYSPSADFQDSSSLLYSEDVSAEPSGNVEDLDTGDYLQPFDAQNPAPSGNTAGTASGSAAGALAVVGGLGLALAILDHPGGGGSSPHVLATPEPTPLVVLGPGIAMLAARRRFKRARK